MPRFIETKVEQQNDNELKIISNKIDSLSRTIANIKPTVNYDNSEVLSALAEILSLMQDHQNRLMTKMEQERKPKKWSFKVNYSMLGKLKDIDAIAVD